MREMYYTLYPTGVFLSALKELGHAFLQFAVKISADFKVAVLFCG
jgi:hypothetical protein